MIGLHAMQVWTFCLVWLKVEASKTIDLNDHLLHEDNRQHQSLTNKLHKPESAPGPQVPKGTQLNQQSN
jgi:hypothetical protein